jgi:hypothetical protein
MTPSNSPVAASVSKKAFEICYALFRISENVSQGSFKESIQTKGLQLLESASEERYEDSLKSLEGVVWLMRIGGGAGLANAGNTDMVIQEADSLKGIIAELINAAILPDSHIAPIFSHLPVSAPVEEKIHRQEQPKFQREEKIKVSLEERKNSIFERIRQLGNCRLKDVQDILPDVSERTIRYDLQTLVEQGVIERIGGGGPGTFYKVRERVGGGVILG